MRAARALPLLGLCLIPWASMPADGPPAAAADCAAAAAKVRSLVERGETAKAAEAAYARAADCPDLRMEAARLALGLGMGLEAFQIAAPLFKDPERADGAYVLSIEALRSEGRETDALGLLGEALARVPAPSDALGRLRAGFSSLGASGEEAPWREVLKGDLPATLPLKEVTDVVSGASLLNAGPRVPRKPAPSAMRWGSGSYSKEPPNIIQFADARETQPGTALPRLALPVTIGGVELWMALDPSVDTPLMSAGAAAKLGLKADGTGRVWSPGLAEPISLKRLLVPSLTVGPLEIRNAECLEVDDSNGLWEKVSGVLPLWTLRHFGVAVEPRKGRLVLLPPGTPFAKALGEGAFEVPVRWFGGSPYAGVVLNGRARSFFMVDPASASSFVQKSALDASGMQLVTTRYGIHYDRGYFGLIESGVAESAEIDFGGSRVRLPSVRAADLLPQTPLEARGLLGRDVLDLYDLYFDYCAGVLALRPVK